MFQTTNQNSGILGQKNIFWLTHILPKTVFGESPHHTLNLAMEQPL